MENVNKVIGKNLLLLRKNIKLTQLELAEKFNYSDKTISKWETGESLPSIEILYELAKFYNVTLDDLTNEDFSVEKNAQNKIKPVKNKMFPTHLIITLLAVSVVWLLATVLFVSLKLTLAKFFPLIFLWAVPVSCIVMIIFNAIWGKTYILFPLLTILIWSCLLCLHLQLIFLDNIWTVYLLGIPLQIAVILWGAMLKKPLKPRKSKEAKNPKNRANKEQKTEQAEKKVEKTEPKTVETANDDENLSSKLY